MSYPSKEKKKTKNDHFNFGPDSDPQTSIKETLVFENRK